MVGVGLDHDRAAGREGAGGVAAGDAEREREVAGREDGDRAERDLAAGAGRGAAGVGGRRPAWSMTTSRKRALVDDVGEDPQLVGGAGELAGEPGRRRARSPRRPRRSAPPRGTRRRRRRRAAALRASRGRRAHPGWHGRRGPPCPPRRCRPRRRPARGLRRYGDHGSGRVPCCSSVRGSRGTAGEAAPAFCGTPCGGATGGLRGGGALPCAGGAGGSSPRRQYCDHLSYCPEGAAAVADRVLLRRRQLRRGRVRRRRGRRSGRSRSRSCRAAPGRAAREHARRRPTPGRRGARARRRRRTRAPRLVDVGELAEHQFQVGWSSPCLPAQRADRMPGMPFSASTVRARVVGDGGQPGVRGDRAGLEQRVVRERAARLGTSGASGNSSSPTSSPLKPASARMRLSSATLCAFRVASTTRGAWHPPASELPLRAACCRRVSSAQPAVPRSSRLFSSVRGERLALGGALHLHEVPGRRCRPRSCRSRPSSLPRSRGRAAARR